MPTYPLDESQREAYQALAAHIDSGSEHGTICLVGEFQSGKTNLVKHLLDEKLGDSTDYYVNLNLYLLDELDKQRASIAYAGAKAKIHLLIQIAIEDLLDRHFQTHNLLVLDAIEMIYSYELNLVTITDRFARDGKCCIICVPESKKHNYYFDFSWGLVEVIQIN
jgi:predicted AAA+ superfamily ATPase